MARPERKNADYFPFYAKDGRTLFLLESKYKCKGTGFFTNVMRFLTLETNHHVSILDETDRMYFFSKCHCDEESGMDMLNIMSKTGKINNNLWTKMVIASQALLDSLTDAYRNRKNSIITMSEIEEKYITCNGNGVSYTGNPQETVVSGVDNTQTKLKESKLKESKELTAFSNADEVDFYLTRKKKKLSGKRLNTFNLFWESFNYKKGRAEAADSWLEIPFLTDALVDKIIKAAKIEAENRVELKKQGKTPKMAQGWLSGKRWEDDFECDTTPKIRLEDVG